MRFLIGSLLFRGNGAPVAGLILAALFLASAAPTPAAAKRPRNSGAGIIAGVPMSRQTEGKSPGDQDSADKVSLGAALVQVPTVVTDRSGAFIKNLTKADFTVSEDGKRKPVDFFAAVTQPFNIVIVLDTSNSADDRLKAMQSAAVEFIQTLSPQDTAMVVTFDNEVRKLTDFTSDKSELEEAIRGSEAGFGKLLYEGVAEALTQLRDQDGRKAVILFTDGVDLDSIDANAEGTTKLAEEVGAAIYSVQFDTRWWVESRALKQVEQESKDTSIPYQSDGRVPLPPGGTQPGDGPNAPTSGRGGPIQVENPMGVSIKVIDDQATPDDVRKQCDSLYGKAGVYLKGLADKTGARSYTARTVADTRAAFAKIADELRNQYVLGYYADASHADGKYHKIKVVTDRKDALVRARDGYRATSE